MKRLPVTRGLLVALLLPITASAYEPAGFVPPDPPQIASDGVSDAAKVKIIGLSDGTLILVYGQGQDVGQEVYDVNTRTLRHPMDIVVQYSIDDGENWSAPVNIDGTAAQTSQLGIIEPGIQPPVFPEGHEFAGALDLASDSRAIPFPGDSSMPQAFNAGNHIVVVFSSRYCPANESRWPGETQRVVAYPIVGWVTYPYSCLYASRMQWNSGAQSFNPIGDNGELFITEQLTSGYRDVNAYGASPQQTGFAMTWQEDPLGVQLTIGEGTEHGASEAFTTGGTDVWYSPLYTHNNRADRFGVCLDCHTRPTAWVEPVRLTANVVEARGLEEADAALASHAPGLYDHGEAAASRPQVKLVGSRAVVAWEERKSEIHQDGKYLRYHTWDRFQSTTEALPIHGCIISDPRENARRARVLAQPTTAGNTNIVFLFKQGLDTEAAPSDIVMRRALGGFDPANVVPAIDAERCRAHVNNADEDTEGPDEDLDDPGTDIRIDDLHLAAVNLSGTTAVGQQPGGALDADTSANELEDGKGLRGVLKGDELLVAYSHVPDLPSFNQFGDSEPYNLYVMVSSDGGATWHAVHNLSGLSAGEGLTEVEPRLVPTSNSGPGCAPASAPVDPTDCQDPKVYYVGFGTQIHSDQGEPKTHQDVYMSITTDGGRTFSTPQAISIGDSIFGVGDDIVDRELQLKVRPDGAEAYVVWSTAPATTEDVAYLRLTRDLVLGSSFEDD